MKKKILHKPCSGTVATRNIRLEREHSYLVNALAELPKIYEYLIDFKIPSLNDYYSGRHWSYRKKTADSVCLIMSNIIRKNKPHPILTFRIDISYNSRLDVDNTILASKFFADSLRRLNIIENDDTRYYKGLSIIYDKNLPATSYRIKLQILQYQSAVK